MRALHTAATGMMAQELNVQVISNNIANMRTTGYKRQRAEFQDLLYEYVSRVGTQTSAQGNILPAGIELGSGVKTAGTPRLMSQGELTQTGKDFDLAIRGEGFLKVLLPDGRTSYTRDGSLELDAQGRLVTAQGNLIQPGITIPQNAMSVSVNAQGQVFVTQSIGDNMYLETPASGAPQNGNPNTDGFGNLQQGFLEQANVEAVSEISDLIAAQRAYEMNAKVISAADQMLSATSNMMR
jgi:flagellar basal-body rod protein FlgG